MGTIYIPNQGEARFLTKMTANNISCRLYKNDVTAGLSATQIAALTAASFTVADFTGYSNVTITGGTWTITGADPSYAVNSNVTFTSSANQTVQNIYGWYLVDVTSGDLLFFNKFDAAIPIQFNADAIIVPPYIYLGKNGDLMPVGACIPYAGGDYDTTIYGLADGGAISRTAYPEFFAQQNAIGLPHGVGDGSTTFNKPDIRQRFVLGRAASGTGSAIGATGGSIDHTHSLETSAGSDGFAKLTTAAAGYVAYNNISGQNYSSDIRLTPTGGATKASIAQSGLVDGVELGGDTSATNPPFVSLPYLIKLR
jgi:microcystin-dependent protein